MMEVLDISPSLADFVDKVRDSKPEEMVVPAFYISRWPRSVGDVEVRIRKFGFVTRVDRSSGGLFRLFRWFCLGISGFMFQIDSSGTIKTKSFASEGYNFSNDNPWDPRMVGRANALLLFKQLKDRALPKIIEKVEKDTRNNNEAVEAVRKALEPFLPQIVADELER